MKNYLSSPVFEPTYPCSPVMHSIDEPKLRGNWITRRKHLKSALYISLKNAVFKICPGHFHEKLRKKFRNTVTLPFVFGKRFRSSDMACSVKPNDFGYNVKSSDIACWEIWERSFPNLRLLLSKTQCSLDITSKIRIVLKKNIGGYLLRKPNWDAEKCLKKRRPFGLFDTPVCCKISNTWRGSLWRQKDFKKVAQCRKNERVDPSVSSGFANARKSLAKARTRTRDRSVPAKPIKVCVEKWYIQGELCGLTKKS